MRRRIYIPILIAGLLLVAGLGYKLINNTSESAGSDTVVSAVQTRLYREPESRAELVLPVEYEMVKMPPAGNNEEDKNSKVVMRLQRTEPQSFVIVQHDTGLASPAAMLRQNPTEYVENTIRQFYSVRYGSSYKSEGIKRTKVGDRDAIEHVYSYTDKDGKPNKVRLLAIIWSPDETYNIILQSHTDNFERVKGDLDTVRTTFKAPE